MPQSEHSTEEVMGYYGEMIGAWKAMSPEKRAELETWERTHLTGSGTSGTSDWPGWKELGIVRPGE